MNYGSFRVKYISRCFYFRRSSTPTKIAKISLTRTRVRSRDRIPCRAIGEELERRTARARECSGHPCRITDGEGTAIGYLPRKSSPVCFGPRFQLPSEVRFRDRALGWYRSAVAIGPAVLTTYSRYRPEMRAHLEPALALIYPKPPAGPIATSGIAELSDLPGSEHHRQVSGSAAEPYLYFDSRKLTRLV